MTVVAGNNYYHSQNDVVLSRTETELLFDYLHCGCRCISICGSGVYISCFVIVAAQCRSGARKGKRFRIAVPQRCLSLHQPGDSGFKHLRSKVFGSAPFIGVNPNKSFDELWHFDSVIPFSKDLMVS